MKKLSCFLSLKLNREIFLMVILFVFAHQYNFAANRKLPFQTVAKIDSIVFDAISQQVFPGCQVLVAHNGKTIYNKSFGFFTYECKQQVLSTTLYDLASLSKSTGTLFAIMKLYDNGQIQLTDKASLYLEFLRGTNKESITITDLLFHETGLPAYMSFGKRPLDFTQEQILDSARRKIASAKLGAKTYLYSCVNFMLLKEIVEAVSKKQLDVFLNENFYTPMKLQHIGYLPLQTHKANEIAPTLQNESLPTGYLQGTVHDPDAAFLGGVSGNAGLFANAADVAAMYQILLNNGEFKGERYLKPQTCTLFMTTTSASGRRGLGFDKPVPANPAINPCCESAPNTIFGHTGYTGTCCWVDPENKLIYVFLSNRTFPNDSNNKLSKLNIRPKIQEVFYTFILNTKKQ